MKLSIVEITKTLRNMFYEAESKKQKYIDISVFDLVKASNGNIDSLEDCEKCKTVLENNISSYVERAENDTLLNSSTVRFIIPRTFATMFLVTPQKLHLNLKKEKVTNEIQYSNIQIILIFFIGTFFSNSPDSVLTEKDLVTEICKKKNIPYSDNLIIRIDDIKKALMFFDDPLSIDFGTDYRFFIKLENMPVNLIKEKNASTFDNLSESKRTGSLLYLLEDIAFDDLSSLIKKLNPPIKEKSVNESGMTRFYGNIIHLNTY